MKFLSGAMLAQGVVMVPAECRLRTMSVPRGHKFGPRKPPPPVDRAGRLLAKIDVRGPDECWPWTGTVNSWGYGQTAWGLPGQRAAAHVAAWELSNGRPRPEGHDIDHKCHNADLTCRGDVECRHRRCCNPAHLAPATRGRNTANGPALAAWSAKAAAQTQCKHGHLIDGWKRDRSRPGGGRRYCMTCAREVQSRYVDRKAKR